MSSALSKAKSPELEAKVQKLLERQKKNLSWVRLREKGIFLCLIGCGLFSLLITGSIIFVLTSETITFFRFEEVTLGNFLLSTEWTPLLGNTKSFGIWALISGTLLVTAIAMLLALPGLNSHLPGECASPSPQHLETDFGNSRGDSDGGLRIFRIDDDHAILAVVLRRIQHLQRHECGHCGWNPVFPNGMLAGGGCTPGSPFLSAGRRLRFGWDSV